MGPAGSPASPGRPRRIRLHLLIRLKGVTKPQIYGLFTNPLAPLYGLRADSGDMEKRVSRPPALVIVTLVVMTIAGLLAAMPPLAGICVAVIAAISWCLWLDRHSAS